MRRLGTRSEWCRQLSDRQCLSRSDPIDSSHSETKVWTDAGRGLGWTGSTKSLRNEAYGRLGGLGFGCRRWFCTSFPISSCVDVWAAWCPTSSAGSTFSPSTPGCCASVCVNRARFAGAVLLSVVAPSGLFRACAGVVSPAGSALSGDGSRRLGGSSVPDE